jgi:hypothetical protein
MNIRYTPRQKLHLTRQIHLLTKEGKGRRRIERALHISNDTINRYLALPCPTEEEIAAAPDEHPPGMDTPGGLKQVRAYLAPEDMERLKATSGDAKPNVSDLARQAIRFWCDALEHINGDDHNPVQLCGVKVRFQRSTPTPGPS